MFAATVSGTQASAPTGYAFQTGETVLVEPGPGLSLTVRVGVASPMDVAPIDGEELGAWVVHDEGDELTLAEGERLAFRPHGARGGSLGFTWKR